MTDSLPKDSAGALRTDVSSTITYYALSYGADDDARFEASIHHEYTNPTTLTDGCGGYILMSSNLVYYS